MRPPRQISMNAVTVFAGSALFVALLIAAVALALAGWEPGAVIGFLSAVAGLGAIVLPFLDKLANLYQETRRQTPIIHTINRRVNGELDERIAAAVAAGIERHGATVAAAGPRVEEGSDTSKVIQGGMPV